MAFDDNTFEVYFFFSIFHINMSPNRSDIPINKHFAVISELSCEFRRNCNLTMGEEESCTCVLKILVGWSGGGKITVKKSPFLGRAHCSKCCQWMPYTYLWTGFDLQLHWDGIRLSICKMSPKPQTLPFQGSHNCF